MEHYSKNLLNEKKGITDLKLAIPSLAMSTNLCQAIKKMLHLAVDKKSTDLRNPNRKYHFYLRLLKKMPFSERKLEPEK